MTLLTKVQKELIRITRQHLGENMVFAHVPHNPTVPYVKVEEVKLQNSGLSKRNNDKWRCDFELTIHGEPHSSRKSLEVTESVVAALCQEHVTISPEYRTSTIAIVEQKVAQAKGAFIWIIRGSFYIVEVAK